MIAFRPSKVTSQNWRQQLKTNGNVPIKIMGNCTINYGKVIGIFTIDWNSVLKYFVSGKKDQNETKCKLQIHINPIRVIPLNVEKKSGHIMLKMTAHGEALVSFLVVLEATLKINSFQ